MRFFIQAGRFLTLLAVLALSTVAIGCGGDSGGDETGESGSTSAGGTETP